MDYFPKVTIFKDDFYSSGVNLVVILEGFWKFSKYMTKPFVFGFFFWRERFGASS